MCTIYYNNYPPLLEPVGEQSLSVSACRHQQATVLHCDTGTCIISKQDRAQDTALEESGSIKSPVDNSPSTQILKERFVR